MTFNIDKQVHLVEIINNEKFNKILLYSNVLVCIRGLLQDELVQLTSSSRE